MKLYQRLYHSISLMVHCGGSLMLLLLAGLLLTACGGQTELAAPSDGSSDAVSAEVAAGEALFNTIVLERDGTAVQGCIACHAVDPSVGDLVGPNLAGIAVQATERVPGTPAAEYLRNSIVNPSAYIVEGFDPGTKPNYEELLSEAEIESLVAYLQTLE